jgi:hypothetical protein
MFLPFEHGEFSKVLIQCYDDAFLLQGNCENFGIAGVLGPRACPDHVVTVRSQFIGSFAPDTRVEEDSHSLWARSVGQKRYFDRFVSQRAMRVKQRREDVLTFEPGITLQQRFGRVACGKHAENMLDGKTAPANDRFSTEDLWINVIRCSNTDSLC